MGRRDRSHRHPRTGDVGRGDQGTPGQEYPRDDGGYIPTGELDHRDYYDDPRSYSGGDYDGLTAGLQQMQLEDPPANTDYYGHPDAYSGLDPQAYTGGSSIGHSTYTHADDELPYPYPSAAGKGKQPAGTSGAHDPSVDYRNYPDGVDAYDQQCSSSSIPADEGEAAYQSALRQSAQTALLGDYSQPSHAGSSTYDLVQEEPGSMEPPSLATDTTQSNPFVITQDNDFVLDSRYKTEHSRKYQPGAVFKTLWAEPYGQAPTTDDPLTEYPGSIQGNLKNFYVGIRRFIVVATDHGHSSCVPILTYEHRGCKKSGIRPLQHGIIYARGSRPHRLRNEPDMGFEPVALDMTVREGLDKESRVNYSKIVDVEHNTKVLFIGRLKKEDFRIVQDAVNCCWYNKNHGPSN